MEEIKITETFIVEKIKDYLINKENGNWHEEKTKTSDLHGHGADIIMTGLNVKENLMLNPLGK